MSTENEIIEKVRKLLRLAQSANPHEAGLALERAMRLAARHKIDVAGLDLDPEIERIIHQRFPVGQRLSYIAKLTLNVVVAFFHVEVVVAKPDAVFVGTATDVAIAHYVHGFLSGACRRALDEFEKSKRRKPSLSRRQNFIAGWIYGVRYQLGEARQAVELEDSKFALAVAEQSRRREEYASSLFPKTRDLAKRKVRRNQSTVMAGFAAGRETTIRTPLNPAPEVLRLQ